LGQIPQIVIVSELLELCRDRVSFLSLTPTNLHQNILLLHQ